ncbi:MAG: DUF4097 family beta strand repeat-containing protein [Gemmatimonadota bacterium]|nr:DUF4097 family beta strand repeat-containing protein [Gemmatimonadota bacterium]
MRPFMSTILILAAALGLPATTAAQSSTVDTLISVSTDGRLELHNGNGTVEIDTWEQNRVRIRARRSGAAPIRIDKKGVALVVQSPRQMKRDVKIDYTVTVPASMDLTVHGMRSPVTIRGTRGRVEVHTINGEIDLQGGRERVEVHTVNGPVSISGARGRVEVQGVNQSVRLRDFSGEAVSVNAVNGTVTFEDVDARTVQAVTVNGQIRFQGVIRENGSYEMNAHNGGIEIVIPEETSARIHVSTFKGTLRAGFPVTIEEGPQGRRFDLTLGSGEARIDLTSFNGTIELRRPRR